VAVASAVSVIPTLVVPVPRPASLNMVFSAPVLVSMLLLANRKCGLSASAVVADITTVATAEMSMNAMRRIVLPLIRFLELHWSRSASPSPPPALPRRAHARRNR
jgi:hypothetical protein